MTRWLRFGALPLAVGLLLIQPRLQSTVQDAQTVRFPADVAPRNDILVDNHVPVRMRDGVTLYADVYRPTGSGRHPVLLSVTPYSTERFPTAYDAAVYFAQRGYVYVFQDVRGRHESEGVWVPFVNDEKDAYDTIEWAAKQPWSDGKVAMQGGSYLGQNQWRAAQAKPASLVTIFPMVASTSIYHDWITLNGGWRLSFNFGWGPVRQESRIMQNPGPHTIDGLRAIHYDQVQRHLPLNTMQQLVGRHARFYDDWLANPDYNAYWKPFNVEEQFDKIAVPVHTFGGWFDIFSQGTLRGYVGMSQKGATDRARRGSNLVIGPWGHGPTQKFGALDFGPTANVDALTLQLRWYDHWLKGMDNGLASEAPVKLFVMGRNAWVYEREYPLARTDYRPLYFSSGGNANTAGGDGRLTWTKPAGASPQDRFRYDPNDPVPSVGGNNCCGTPTAAGPQDQRSIEGPPRRSRLHYRRPAGRARGHRPGQGGAVCSVRCRRHGFRRQAGRRASRRLELQHGGGNPARAVPREPDATHSAEAWTGVSPRDRSGGHFDRVSERPPDPGARDEQPLSPVRSQSEHGSYLCHDGRGQGG